MKKYILMIICLLVLTSTLSGYYFSKNKIEKERIEWSHIKTIHFDIYFDSDAPEFGKTAALMAEEAYYYLRKDFKMILRSRIPIVFYKSHHEFQGTNIIYPIIDEAIGGFTESAKNRVAVPFTGSYKDLEEVLIHELTHAYVNQLQRSSFNLLDFVSIPFWFSEGLPEFESIRGVKKYNQMFIIDLLINGNIPNLDNVGGYFAYRLGESFLSFINKRYDRKKVMEFFYALKIAKDSDTASQKVFNLKFKDLQEQWKNYLKKKYFPLFDKYSPPTELYERITDHQQDGSNINFAPRFSPSGLKFLYFSNRGLRTSIWLGNTLDVVENEKLLTGETSANFQNFHFQRNNFSWFPDSVKFAFVSRSTKGDNIYIMNSQTKEIIRKITFYDYDAVYEIDISHDGKRIVFSGQKNLKNDIFIYNLTDDSIKRITSDKYYDSQPVWSPDDSKIAFTSDRITSSKKEEHIFYGLSENIFLYDLINETFSKVTDDSFSNKSPIWTNDGNSLLFISEQEECANYHIINLSEGTRAKVTKAFSGLFEGDLNHDETQLIFSGYYNQGWDIYIKNHPLQNLEYYEYHKPQPYKFEADFEEIFELKRYQYYGYREREFKRELPDFSKKNITRFELGDISKLDSINKAYNIKIDKKPKEKKIPKIKPYKLKFSIDRIWGGMAYSPSGGTYGQMQLAMSDLMGNHSIGLSAGVFEEFRNSDIIVNYLYLANKIDYGLGGFFLNDDLIYQIISLSEDPRYMRERLREYGLYGIIRYPFSKFLRLDFESTVQKYEINRDMWDANTGQWDENQLDADINLPVKEDELIYSPRFTLIHDNTKYGSVGPLTGWRAALIYNHNFSNEHKPYSIYYADLRKYFFFAKRYSIAGKLIAGAVTGETDKRFKLDDMTDVRGYSENEEIQEDLQGRNKFTTSIELRFPFIDNMKTTFPFPLHIYNMRGSAYLDVGAVWNSWDELNIYEDDRFHDLKLGFGTGPRLNMGYFVVKFDVAWHTDLMSTSKPTFYWSLSENF